MHGPSQKVLDKLESGKVKGILVLQYGLFVYLFRLS